VVETGNHNKTTSRALNPFLYELTLVTLPPEGG